MNCQKEADVRTDCPTIASAGEAGMTATLSLPDRVLGVRTLFTGWLDLLMLKIRLNGVEEERPIVVHPNGSAVLAYDPVRRVALMVAQTRCAILFAGAAPAIEAIAGVAEEDDFAVTARREAEEEAGVRLTNLQRVSAVWMDPNTSTERVHLYLGQYGAGDRIGEGGGLPEENERLTVVERPLCDLWDEVMSADFADAKTLLLLQALRLRNPELFTADAQ